MQDVMADVSNSHRPAMQVRLGERVVVSRGVLAGIEGLVIQVDDCDRIILKPDGVVAGVLLRLPPSHIEPLHS